VGPRAVLDAVVKRKFPSSIRIDLRESGWGVVDWIHLAQDRDQWRDIVNTVMNLRVPKMWGIS
jgi:hypothetical protein